MKAKIWMVINLVLVLSVLAAVGFKTVEIDPFFHYHSPLTQKYYYTLNNPRSMNNGIVRHFDYDAVVTGTSMTQNFKTSEMDNLFGTNSIKISFPGATYKEVNDTLLVALSNNPNLKTVVRCIDLTKLFDAADFMRNELGKYPTYLYDNNIFNDVEYVFNRNVIFNRVYSMLKATKKENFEPGILSFDRYSNWMADFTFGKHAVNPEKDAYSLVGEPIHITEAEKATIMDTIEKTVISSAREYPDTTFYYFFSPYSADWWYEQVAAGTVYKQIEAEQLYIEEILKYDNIKLFSFNGRTDITTDLNNYKDLTHYGEWVNSLVLKWIHDGQYQLTEDNYKQYLDAELSFYTTYDYSKLNDAEDYECDYYAAALVQQELTGVAPYTLSEDDLNDGVLNKAEVVTNQFNGSAGIKCVGSLQREDESLGDYLLNTEYIGMKLNLDVTDYSFMTFYGKKDARHGQPTVAVYDETNKVVSRRMLNYKNIDNDWHMYYVDLKNVTGKVDIIFNGGYVDSSGSPDSAYSFANIVLY